MTYRPTGVAVGDNQLSRYAGTLTRALRNQTSTAFQPINANLTSISAISGSASGLLLDTAGGFSAVNLTGDATTSGSSITLATVNSNVGTFGSSTVVPIITVNGKGLITGVSTASVSATINAVVSTHTSSYTESASNGIVVALCNATAGNIVVTLPAVASFSGEYTVKKIDSSAHTVTLTPAGTEKIDNASTQVISYQYNAITIVSDNSNWWII